MKQVVIFFFGTFFFLGFSQEDPKRSYIDVNFFRGNIAKHNPDISHLITGHPDGFVLSYNRKTFGFEDWEARYNYPDYGISFAYQNLQNEFLGENLSLYAHYNFYFLKRNLMFRIGQGLGVTSSPYDREENFRNIAFGSRLMSSTYAMLNYKKENILDRFGLQAGFTLIHYSNANVKAPNTSINSITFNVGFNYQLQAEDTPPFQPKEPSERFTEPFRYNVAFRSGVNESDVIGSGQYPFYIVSAYADKRLSHVSALQAGVDVFFSNFLKEWIRYRGIAFPGEGIEGDEDFKRVGLFVGHELFINRTSIEAQLGYYVYYPVDFEGQLYQRIGLKRYFGDTVFGALTLKSHGAKAEAVEFGIGVRL